MFHPSPCTDVFHTVRRDRSRKDGKDRKYGRTVPCPDDPRDLGNLEPDAFVDGPAGILDAAGEADASRAARLTVRIVSVSLRRGTARVVDVSGAVDGRMVGPAVPAGYRPKGTWPVVLVGEAPGAEEVERGEPFVGRAGRLLTAALERAGVQREELWITNVFWQRPPDNHVRAFFGSDEPLDPWPPLDRSWPLPGMRVHLRRLVEEIRTLDPVLVVAVGRTALWALTGRTSIGEAAGRDHRALGIYGPRVVHAVRHPAWALRATAEDREDWMREISNAAARIREALDGRTD